MAPDKGLSSSFRRNVPEDRNKSYGWKTPAEQWPGLDFSWYRQQQVGVPLFWMPVMTIIPTSVASEFIGVQPLAEPMGLIFSMRMNYEDK
jgi:hypothetical protein